jgi:hypothetical protein
LKYIRRTTSEQERIMKTLRTPDDRFENLPDYDFEPHYTKVGGMRMHYVDEGPQNADAVLLLHGEPSWSYLYRHMIPPLAAAASSSKTSISATSRCSARTGDPSSACASPPKTSSASLESRSPTAACLPAIKPCPTRS